MRCGLRMDTSTKPRPKGTAMISTNDRNAKDTDDIGLLFLSLIHI